MSVCQNGSPATLQIFYWREFSECIIYFGPFQQGAQLEVYSNLDCFSFELFDLLPVIIMLPFITFLWHLSHLNPHKTP